MSMRDSLLTPDDTTVPLRQRELESEDVKRDGST